MGNRARSFAFRGIRGVACGIVALVLAALLAVVLGGWVKSATMAGASEISVPSASQEQAAASDSDSSRDSYVRLGASGHVTTSYFEFDIPQSWLGSVDVAYTETNGYPRVDVLYRDNPDLVLITMTVVDASRPQNGGDIANSLIASWENGCGQRVELWGRNYVYRSQMLAQPQSSAAQDAYPDDSVEEALVDLSTGGAYTVEMARHADEGNGSAVGCAYYATNVLPTVQVK